MGDRRMKRIILLALVCIVLLVSGCTTQDVNKFSAGEYREDRLKVKIDCDNNVIFTGLLNNKELTYAYSASDIVVHPSLFETFTRIGLEAWTYRKPIVCFDLGGPTEFISREAGIIVKYNDVTALSQAMIKLLADPMTRKSMGNNGFKLIINKYSWQNVATEIENIYQLVCKE